jgi:hypothetical protein
VSTYDEYLLHKYQGGCNDLDCQWCFPPGIPEASANCQLSQIHRKMGQLKLSATGRHVLV